MTSTTIKVSRETRDRLRDQARRAHLTLGEHLMRLADGADREERFRELRRAMAATAVDQHESYVREAESWEATELTDAAGK